MTIRLWISTSHNEFVFIYKILSIYWITKYVPSAIKQYVNYQSILEWILLCLFYFILFFEIKRGESFPTKFHYEPKAPVNWSLQENYRTGGSDANCSGCVQRTSWSCFRRLRQTTRSSQTLVIIQQLEEISFLKTSPFLASHGRQRIDSRINQRLKLFTGGSYAEEIVDEKFTTDAMFYIKGFGIFSPWPSQSHDSQQSKWSYSL